MNEQPDPPRSTWRADYMLEYSSDPLPPVYTVADPVRDEPFRLRLADLPYDEPDDSAAAEEG